MQVYLFDKEYAKSHKAYWSTFKYVSLLLLAILPISFLFGFSMSYFEDQLTEMMMTLLGIGFLIIFIPLIVFVAIYGEFFYMARVTGYVKDEWGILWQVQFMQKNTLKRVKCNEENVRNYFLRFREGESFFHPIFGGPCKITRLKDLDLIKEKAKYNIYSYMSESGKKRKIRIPRAYPTLEKLHQNYIWY